MVQIKKETIESISKHVKIMNDEMGELRDHQNAIKLDLAEVKTDVSWLKRFFFIIASSSIGALIVGLFQLIKG